MDRAGRGAPPRVRPRMALGYSAAAFAVSYRRAPPRKALEEMPTCGRDSPLGLEETAAQDCRPIGQQWAKNTLPAQWMVDDAEERKLGSTVAKQAWQDEEQRCHRGFCGGSNGA